MSLRESAASLKDALDAALPSGAEALGPAPRFRVRGRERRQLLIKAQDRAAAVAAVRETVHAEAAARRLRGMKVSVDVDAQ